MIAKKDRLWSYSIYELKNILKRGLDNLKESLEILNNEPQGSFESKIVEGSKDSVTQLEQWVGTVCSSIWINCDLGNLICKYRNILESFIIKLLKVLKIWNA